MQEEYRLLKHYDRKKLDSNFFESYLTLLLNKEPELKDYVKDIIVENKICSDNRMGSYNCKEKLIRIYLPSIRVGIKYKDTNLINIIALEILRHEFSHAESYHLIDERKSDIKSYILRYANLQYSIDNGLLLNYYNTDLYNLKRKDNYLINPMERIAEIDSWKYIINIIKNDHNTEELLYARVSLYYSLIRGYNDNNIFINCPTYDFLLNTGLLKDYKYLKNIVEDKNYSFDTRIENGLPITYDELNEKTYKKCLIQKKY